MYKQGWLQALLMLCMCLMGAMALNRNMLRTYFKCPECDPSACPEPKGCLEKVKEPGICACCYTCARIEGEECGVFTERCAPGLTCQPMGVDRRADQVWNAFFKGKGICVPTGMFKE